MIYFALSRFERIKGFTGHPLRNGSCACSTASQRPSACARAAPLPGIVLVFLFAPLVVMALYAFHNSAALGLPFRGFSLRWFEQGAEDPAVRIGGEQPRDLARRRGGRRRRRHDGCARYRSLSRPRRRVCGSSSSRRSCSPASSTALAAHILQRRGIALSLWTATLGHVVILLPVFYVIVYIRLARFDPLLEEAARDLGATPWQSFRRVVLPLIAPAIIGGGLLTVARSWDELPVALFNSGIDNTVPRLIYTRIRVIVEPTIDVIAVLLLAATVVLMLGARRVVIDSQSDKVKMSIFSSPSS